MAPALPRTGFNSSGLVRLLAALAVADVAGPKQNFADRLGLWLDWTDAIALSTALQAGPAAPSPGAKPAAAPPVPTPTPTSGITEEFTRVRADLAKLISTDAVFRADQPGSSVPPPVPGAHAAGGLDFAPYRRSHRAHQRAMEARIGPLRSQVRAALSRRSPALGRLAALDAVLDQALAARERHLLSTVPTLLEARFRRLDKGHQEGSAQHGGLAIQTPACSRRAGWPGTARTCRPCCWPNWTCACNRSKG